MLFRKLMGAFFIAMVALLLLAPTPPTEAASFAASDATTLINAINSANANAETDTIFLTADISLTAVNNPTDGSNGLPSITSEIRIEGHGYTLSRAGAAPNFRIFHVASTGNLTLTHVTLSGGVADNQGGGIYVDGGTVNLINSTLSGNSGVTGAGGGIRGVNSSTVNLTNTTVSNNTSVSSGGGMRVDNSTLTVTNSTISGNVAGIIASGAGGGILGISSTITIQNSTISGNSVGLGQGGIGATSGTITINNTIIADNQLFGGGVNNCGFGSLIVGGANNLSDNPGSDGCPAANFNLIIPNGWYNATLADNGGPTQTHALIPIDPVTNPFNPALNASVGGTATDQRGVPAQGIRDIGAYELGATGLVTINPTYPTVEFASAGATYNETDGTVTIDLTVSGAADFGAVAQVSIMDMATSTATNGSDFSFTPTVVDVDCSSGTCPSTVSVTLTLLTDALVEPDETVDLQIIGTNGFATLGTQVSFTATITDVPPPQVSVFDPALSKIGELGSGELGLPGETITWTITATNNGAIGASDVVVSDTFIAELQIDDATTTQGTVSISGQTVTVNIGTLDAGQSVTMTVTTTVLSSPVSGQFSNTATLNGGGQTVSTTASVGGVNGLPDTGYPPR